MKNPIRYFNSSPEVIRLAVMMYIRYPLSLRQVEDLLFERGWTLLTKVATSCDRILIAGGANVEAEWEQGPAV